MILKRGKEYFSIERLAKRNLFSETKSGSVFVHMFVYEKNCVPLLADEHLKPDVVEQNLYVSPRGNFGFRNIVDVTYLKYPIQGKFEYSEYSGGLLAAINDSQYKCVAKAIAKSRRYIKDYQLEEIRRNGNFDVEFEESFYLFIKFPVVNDIEYEFRFFDYDHLIRILIELRKPVFSNETNYDYLKNVLNNVRFFIKVDQLKQFNKTDQQFYYKIDNTVTSTKKILKKILLNFDNKYYISNEYGYISCKEEEIYLRINREIKDKDIILIEIPREVILESLESLGLFSFQDEDEYIPV
jgi:hypothetical protein